MNHYTEQRFRRNCSFFVLLFPLFFFACGGNEDKEGSDNEGFTGAEAEKEDTSKTKKGGSKTTFYGVPTPHQMLSMLEGYDKEASKEHLLETKKVEDAVSSDHKAMLLGIYSTDLAYTSVFGMGQVSLDYFKTVRQLGEDLEVSSAFDQETIEKIEESVGSQDSLTNISKDTYLEAFDYLERNERGKTLALLVAGGWTEALYLSVNMVDEYEKGDPAIDYIAQEKEGLKNVMKFMEQYEENGSVAELLDRMKGLRKAYDALEESGGTSEMKKDEGGGMVLSGGSSVKISEEDLNKIRKEVKALRKEMVEGQIDSSS